VSAYYNDNDLYCCEWLRNLIAAGLIPAGEVDMRPIQEVAPDDLKGFTQVHLFAGIGGWAYAARLAGWPDDRPLWTGSCPCQPFSVAGKRKGAADERHLWPHFHRLIRACRPLVVMGEQVSGKAGYAWLDRVRSDLEAEGYTCQAADIPACAVGAPHVRQRLYWIAAFTGSKRLEALLKVGAKERATERGDRKLPYLDVDRYGPRNRGEALPMHDPWNAGCRMSVPLSRRMGYRPVFSTLARVLAQSGISGLAHGVPCRVAKLRALGNAIVPPLAAEVIRAWLEAQ
jgi:DNA (cytosine-5)-methyltransferase 1